MSQLVFMLLIAAAMASPHFHPRGFPSRECQSEYRKIRECRDMTMPGRVFNMKTEMDVEQRQSEFGNFLQCVGTLDCDYNKQKMKLAELRLEIEGKLTFIKQNLKTEKEWHHVKEMCVPNVSDCQYSKYVSCLLSEVQENAISTATTQKMDHVAGILNKYCILKRTINKASKLYW